MDLRTPLPSIVGSSLLSLLTILQVCLLLLLLILLFLLASLRLRPQPWQTVDPESHWKNDTSPQEVYWPTTGMQDCFAPTPTPTPTPTHTHTPPILPRCTPSTFILLILVLLFLFSYSWSSFSQFYSYSYSYSSYSYFYSPILGRSWLCKGRHHSQTVSAPGDNPRHAPGVCICVKA